MLSFQDCRKAIFEAVSVCETEVISVRQALGRVLAEDLILPRDYPDTPLSAVDGYALRLHGRSEFKNVGVVAAGRLPDFNLGVGECAAVMTGATVPDGTDCVVRVEDCQESNGDVITPADLKPGVQINQPGYEAAAGTLLAKKGTRIKHALYPVLYYAGISQVKVYQRPVIGVLTTGNELREVDDGPAKGQVFNTNRYILDSVLHAIGLECSYGETVRDNETATREALESMAERCDVIVSSGGVSMGRFDFIKTVFHQTDFSLLLQGTPIKPGRPLMVTERKGKLFFGIPGYPAAFWINTMAYLVPALKMASGRLDYEYHLVNARLMTPMVSNRGKANFNRCRLELENGVWKAWGVDSQKTSCFLNLAQANGLVVLPEDASNPAVGDMVQVLNVDLELS